MCIEGESYEIDTERSARGAIAQRCKRSGNGDLKTLFAKHWQISKEFTLAVAEAMPAEYYNFKPNPEEMSFGELMSHIAQSNSEAFADVADIEPLPVPSGYDRSEEHTSELQSPQ